MFTLPLPSNQTVIETLSVTLTVKITIALEAGM
jgi:hypothetical protein